MTRKKPAKQQKIIAQKLERCKKCSSRGAIFGLTKNKQYRVLCSACNAQTETYNTPDEAAEVWNNQQKEAAHGHNQNKNRP